MCNISHMTLNSDMTWWAMYAIGNMVFDTVVIVVDFWNCSRDFYHLHPKDGKRLYFSVYLLVNTQGEGTLVPGPFLWVPQDGVPPPPPTSQDWPPGQVMLQAVCLVRFPTGRLSCLEGILVSNNGYGLRNFLWNVKLWFVLGWNILWQFR